MLKALLAFSPTNTKHILTNSLQLSSETQVQSQSLVPSAKRADPGEALNGGGSVLGAFQKA